MELHYRIMLYLVLLSMPLIAGAHGVDLFARVEGSNLVGTMRFADGTPVSLRPVKAFAPDGSLLEETQTDEAGHFTLPVRELVRHRLVGEAGEGHRGLFTVSESEIRSAVSTGEAATGAADAVAPMGDDAPVSLEMVEAVVSRQLGPLRDQLHAHEKKVRLQDVLGGMGYIFGVLGLYVLVKQRLSRGDG